MVPAARIPPAAQQSSGGPSGGIAPLVSLVAFVGYFALLHWLVVGGAAPWLALAIVAAPWVVAAASLRGRRAVAAGVATIVAVVGAGAFAAFASADPARTVSRWASGLATHVDALLFVENVVFLVGLATLFGSSLRGPGDALVTRLARIARAGDMPPPVVRYTRVVTVVWTLFFALAAIASVILFATRSRAAWSGFVNLSLWPMTGALFALEYAVRLRVLHDVPHVPMRAGIDAFRRRDRRDIGAADPTS